MCVVLSQEPFNHKQEGWFVTGRWPASWIAHPDVSLTEPSVSLYRLLITIHERRTIRFHVSADQRYALFLDGNRLGRGVCSSIMHCHEEYCYDGWRWSLYIYNWLC